MKNMDFLAASIGGTLVFLFFQLATITVKATFYFMWTLPRFIYLECKAEKGRKALLQGEG